MALNVGKSTKIMMAKRDVNGKWLEEHLGVSRTRVSGIVNSPDAGAAMINKLASLFEIPVSEFIALGESE
jgi:plasmid maintenance system antidote protein VapI